MSEKVINISGTHNRYMIKKYNTFEEKKIYRYISKKWDFDNKYYLHSEQLNLLNKNGIKCFENENDKNENDKNENDKNENIWSLMNKEICNKISSYKHQDIIKKLFDKEKFISRSDVLEQMKECQMTCYYCKTQVCILYEKPRENNQWTVDRIDNNYGHNNNNYYISCLDCNLKRGIQNDQKFKFTKQLNIKKV
jgi:hypothetical protein